MVRKLKWSRRSLAGALIATTSLFIFFQNFTPAPTGVQVVTLNEIMASVARVDKTLSDPAMSPGLRKLFLDQKTILVNLASRKIAAANCSQLIARVPSLHTSTFVAFQNSDLKKPFLIYCETENGKLIYQSVAQAEQ